MSSDTEKTEADSAIAESACSTDPEVPLDPKAMEWEEARFRVRAYLNYWGVSQHEALHEFEEAVLAGVRVKDDARPFDDLPTAAVEEALAIIDGNIARNTSSSALLGASPIFVPRIGLMFCKSCEGYSKILLGHDAIDENLISPFQWVQGLSHVPEKNNLVMDPQKLMFYRPIVGLRRFLVWLICSLFRAIENLFTAKKHTD